MQTYLKNGYIVSMDQQDTVFDGGGVLVEDDRITAVGKVDPRLVKPDAEVIDLQGRYVLPGFVNTHVHTSQQISRGVGDDVDFICWLHDRMWPFESNMTEEDSYVSTLMTSLELIRSGVTSFAEPGGQFVSGMARGTAESGLRGKLAKSVMDCGEGLPEIWQRTMEQELEQQVVDLEKFHNTADGRVQVWFGLRTIFNNTDELCVRTKELADKYGVGIHMHVAEAKEEKEYTYARWGEGTVKHLERLGVLDKNLLAVHTVWLTDEELELFKKREVKISHNPASAMRVLGFARIPKMLAMGLRPSIGTDGASSSNHMDMVDEMWLTSLIHKGWRLDPTVVPSQDILRMATKWGARALLDEDLYGSLECGKKADLIVIDPHGPSMMPVNDKIAALVTAMHSANIQSTMCDGKWLMRDRKILTLDEEAILKEAEATDLKIYFVVPSHVPFSPNLETSGGRFNPEIIRKALKRPDAVGLSECVGPYITAGFPDLLESFDTTLSMPGKTLQGHLPDMYGPAMSACIAAGVSTDHESFCEKDVFERLRNGCHLMMREGSAARNMPVLLKTVMENHLDTAMVSIVTDDLHTVDLQERGHLDDSLRTALGMGLDFVKAIQMVTVNCARAFNLDREIGGLAPGRRADINITTGPQDFRVLTTFAGGRQITDNGKLLVHYETAEHEPCVLNTMHLKNPITADSFKIHAPAGAKKVKALVMDTLPYMPFTNRRDVELPVVDGVVQCDVEQDVLYIAQVERHGKNGNVGKAFMGGFHIRGGAMASSVGHDNHNIIVMGDSFEDMALAVNRCVELGGGQVIVRSGKVAAEVAYPICGLLSDLPLDELAEKKKELNRVAHEMGTEIAIPFMFLSFICLAAIPAYAITDCGFIDVVQQKVIDPILEVVE